MESREKARIVYITEWNASVEFTRYVVLFFRPFRSVPFRSRSRSLVFLLPHHHTHTQAVRYYDPFVKKHSENILDVTAIVLANLCVACIMTSQNELAEELMRKIEKEEEKVAYADPDKQCFHLCIVNLVIGTLYCAKGNHEFGIRFVPAPFIALCAACAWHGDGRQIGKTIQLTIAGVHIFFFLYAATN